MNCKAGDLAMIVGGLVGPDGVPLKLAGMICRVVRLVQAPSGAAAWEIEPDMQVQLGGKLTRIGFIVDSALQALRQVDDKAMDEMRAIAGVPTYTFQEAMRNLREQQSAQDRLRAHQAKRDKAGD